ncbi:DUF3024 domain-containing protein [Pelobacter seleniigenes]|uniref:DUF3024 domain-containing protein n=1 Tax=Pelobacter seleniigenes TaxID=407188 RepID=UPI0004A72D99|nr:DUF3024 domain-containing protein [Pelobacter seleniigenes]
MSLSEFEIKRIEKKVAEFMDRKRPPAHVRSQLDFGYCLQEQSLELFEIRPRWDVPEEILESGFAKATYVKSTRLWKVYWQRADLKWHRYDPAPEVASVEDFLQLVEEDAYSCFFG